MKGAIQLIDGGRHAAIPLLDGDIFTKLGYEQRIHDFAWLYD